MSWLIGESASLAKLWVFDSTSEMSATRSLLVAKTATQGSATRRRAKSANAQRYFSAQQIWSLKLVSMRQNLLMRPMAEVNDLGNTSKD